MEAKMRRLLLSLALAASLVALGTSAAAGAPPKGPKKVPLFGPNVQETGFNCAAGGFRTEKTFGSVVLDTPGNESTVTGKVKLKGATPNATFAVDLGEGSESSNCEIFTVGWLTTDKKGKAKFQFSAGRFAGDTFFWIFILEEPPPRKDILATPAVELD
jgi:hypothetical protein